MLVTLAGRRQILVVSASRVFGLAPENGALLWSQTWDTDMGINVSQPIIVDKNRFFISSGYGKGAALVEVTGAGNSFTARTFWENINMKNKFNSSVLHEGHVYGLDEGILTCFDVNTGARKWKGGRYGYGQVLLASGHLIVMSDTGELALVKASPAEYSEVARFAALDRKDLELSGDRRWAAVCPQRDADGGLQDHMQTSESRISRGFTRRNADQEGNEIPGSGSGSPCLHLIFVLF